MNDVPASMDAANAASSPTSRSATRAWARASVWAGAVALLLSVFSLYVRPDFMVMLADMVWACF